MVGTLNGETRLHLIVGNPVAQTRSPSGLTEEFAARHVNAVCVPVDVAIPDLDAFMRAARRVRNIDGIVVTMPHKFAARQYCDDLSERARFLGAVNLLRRRSDRGWHGDMTDGVAMVAALRHAGCDPAGRRALVVGAGGAGSAMALALVEAGVSALGVADIDAAHRDRLVERLIESGTGHVSAATAEARGFSLIVNATPAGMKASDPLPLDLAGLDPSATVADFITEPVMTPLLAAARAKGCAVVTGDDMFAVQATLMADILLGSPAK